MKKQLTRVLSAILVLAMALSLLPLSVFAANEKEYPAEKIDGMPKAGELFAIYSPEYGAMMGSDAVSGKVAGCQIATAEEVQAAKPVIKESTGAFKLEDLGNGDYYLICGSRYLTAKDSKTIEFTKNAENGSVWKIEPLKSSEHEGFRILSKSVKFSSKPVGIECYNSTYSLWGYDAGKAEDANKFILSFYKVDAAWDEDGDGYVGVKPDSGELPVAGKKYVIYNPQGEACVGPEKGDEASKSLKAVPSFVNENGNLEIGNSALIFDVEKEGDYYLFKNGDKYLRTSVNVYNSDTNKNENAEKIYFADKDQDYSYWTLQKATGGYIIFNKTGVYGSKSNPSKVCMEFFGENFSGWTYNGNTGLFAMQFHEVEDTYGVGFVVNPKMHIDAKDAYIGLDYKFAINLDEALDVKTVTVKVNDKEAACEKDEEDPLKYNCSVPKADLEGKTELKIEGSAVNVKEVTYGDTATVEVKDEPLIVNAIPAANSATGAEKQPEISAELINIGENAKVTMTVNEEKVDAKVENGKVSYKSAKAMSNGRYAVKVTVVRADSKSTENSWSFFVGEQGKTLYFGQMHSHTAEYSDGAGSLEDAYEHAMNAKDVDFLFVTDHSNYFDTTKTATTDSYYKLDKLTASPTPGLTKWEEARATAQKYDDMRDDFVCGYGYEMTWSGGPGHTNSFNTYGVLSRNNAELNNKKGYAGMHRYNDLMYNADHNLDINGQPLDPETQPTKRFNDAPVVSQFNHPGKTFGNFDNYAGYNPRRDSILNLIEVGNGEGKIRTGSYFPSYAEYDLCLSKGWHVAPTNNQDNHKGNWGDANTCRDVIYTDDFTEKGIYFAQHDRRIYATEDQNLRIFYSLNCDGVDYDLGSIIDIGDKEIKEVTLNASFEDPDGEELGTIQIIGEGAKVIKEIKVSGSSYVLKETIPNTEAYYYLKIVQADQDIAVTAPVWVGVATPVTAEIKTDAALCVTGSSENLTLTLSNAAPEDFTLEGYKLSLVAGETETLIEDVKLDKAEIVKAGANKVINCEYVRTQAGEQELKVQFYGVYNEKPFTCQATMKNKVYNNNDLINIAVDAGHGNFYVSGGYSNNTGNFIEYCADNGVRVDFLKKGEMNYDKLKQYAMVVITVPFDSGEMDPRAFEKDELDAVAKYAKKGGKLIVTTKSDRKNPAEPELNCSVLTNSILEAVGSNVRAADGIIVDNDMKANEAYRVYFYSKENFNTEHRFTKGTYSASNAYGKLVVPGSRNDCGFQLYNAAPLLINEGKEKDVTVLMHGYQTTWGASYDTDFDGSAYVPVYEKDKVTAKMGDVNIMTYEELSGGGWLVTSGCTFFSDYDIKKDQDYSNKYLLQNILRDLTGADNNVEVTPIKDVKNQTEGEYTIEGYITSNASAYDKDTAFFDCIYMQDRNGNGINCFPVAGNFAVGMNVRAHGGVTFYCGEVELNLGTDYNGYIRVISDDSYVVEPKAVSCTQAMSDAEIGNLMKVEGLVTEVHKTEGVIDKIYVKDNSGEACVFINGYISKDYKGLDDLRNGMKISAIGIGSRDVNESGTGGTYFARLRVRDRADVQITSADITVDGLYNDVNKETDWFFDSVEYAVKSGLLLGTSRSTFEPNSNLTRAMAATILYRMAGSPTAPAETSFDDVEEDQWFTAPIAWAQSAGVVNGKGENKFDPDGKITREEMAVMLGRYATNVEEMNIDFDGEVPVFPDNDQVQDWAVKAMNWCLGNKIINGDEGRILPQGNATRAEFATILMRFDNLIGD